MALLDTIKELIQSANAKAKASAEEINPEVKFPTYIVEYEESKMMNVKADNYKAGDSFVYIEEFISGRYVKEKFFKTKTMKMQIYFCKFTQFQVDASVREGLRNTIEAELVEPFMKEFEESNLFIDANLTNWNVYYPFPRFDANEVSVMLEFECKTRRC